MLILGVDPGSRVTGYGIVGEANAEKRLVTAGSIQAKEAGNHPERLKRIYDALTEIIKAHDPGEIAVEMPVYGQNPQSMLKLGRAQAAAMMAGLNSDLPVSQHTPKEIKKSVTGNGNASKKQVKSMVRSILSGGKEGLSHDAYDALATALCQGGRGSHEDKSSYTGWASFVESNPDRVSE